MHRLGSLCALLACSLLIAGCATGAPPRNATSANRSPLSITQTAPDNSTTLAPASPIMTPDVSPGTYAPFQVTTEQGYTGTVQLSVEKSVEINPQDAPPGKTDVIMRTAGLLAVTNTTPSRSIPLEVFGKQPRIFVFAKLGEGCQARLSVGHGACAINGGTFLAMLDYRSAPRGPSEGQTWQLVLRPENGISEGSEFRIRVPESQGPAMASELHAAPIGISWFGVKGALDQDCDSPFNQLDAHFIWESQGRLSC